MCYFLFVNRDADRGHNPSISVSLKGCEITPDIHIGSGKYGIKMSVPSTDGMSDLWVRLWLYICTSNILVIAAAEQLGPGTQNQSIHKFWSYVASLDIILISDSQSRVQSLGRTRCPIF